MRHTLSMHNRSIVINDLETARIAFTPNADWCVPEAAEISVRRDNSACEDAAILLTAEQACVILMEETIYYAKFKNTRKTMNNIRIPCENNRICAGEKQWRK